MKKKCLMLLVCCLLLAVLSACGESGGSGQNEPLQPQVSYYFDGVITMDGQVLFMPEDNKEYLILTDQNGRQLYIMETEKTYDAERRTEYDEPLQTACTYRIYDLQGALQKELNVQIEGDTNDLVNFSFPQDGDLNKFRVMVNQLNYDGTFRILDIDGNVLIDEQVLPPGEADEWQDCYVWQDDTKDFIQVRCSFYSYDPEYKWDESSYFYDLSGQPLEFEQDYMYMYNIYNFFADEPSGYYGAYYENAQGQGLYDILDSNCQVLISGLNEINYCAGGKFVVVRGFERGLMDAQGNWIYQEPVFNELED